MASGELKRLLITLPPRSLKSHLASISFPAWLLGQNPSCKIICASYGDNLAIDFSNATRRVLKADWYRRLFPFVRLDPTKDTQQEMRTSAGGYRLTTTVGGVLTGRGGNIVIIDDPMKAADAESQLQREKVIKWSSETVMSRLDNKREDAIIVIMQRLHVGDLAGHLLETGEWHHLNLVAIAPEDETVQIGAQQFYNRKAGDALHPERESIEDYERLRKEMGSFPFEAQYLQMPVAHGGNMVKWSWFQSGSAVPEGVYGRIVQSWDTASKAGQLNDFSVCITARVVRDSVYILDVFRRRLDYPDLKKAVINLQRQWKATRVLIEDKGSGQSLVQDLRREHIYAKAVEVHTDKVVRMATVSARIENGEVHLPATASWLEEFKHEIMAFPFGKHDDQVDALSQLLAFKSPGPLYTAENIGR